MKKYEQKLKEAKNWIPGMVDAEANKVIRKYVGKIAMELDYSIEDAYAFCVSLLEDVNAHEMAAKVNDILYNDMRNF